MQWLSQQGMFAVGLENSFCQPPWHEVRPDFRPSWCEGEVMQMCVQRGETHSRLEEETRETFG